MLLDNYDQRVLCKDDAKCLSKTGVTPVWFFWLEKEKGKINSTQGKHDLLRKWRIRFHPA
jgi:hypothetical protein